MSFLSQSPYQFPTQFIVRASVAAALGLWLVGCSENRSSQCVKLIGVANNAVNSIEAVTAPSGAESSIEALKKIATVADETKKAMTELSLTDSTLIGFRDRFVTMYEATSAATGSLIQASSAKDTAASQRAYENLKASTSQEAPLVDEVNKFCNAAQ
jgi:hypothetical protein